MSCLCKYGLVCGACRARIDRVLGSLTLLEVFEAARDAAGGLPQLTLALSRVRGKVAMQTRRRTIRAIYERLTRLRWSRQAIARLLEVDLLTVARAVDEA